MTVVDASAIVLGLLDDGDARSVLAHEVVAVPHLADSEIANALRAHVLRGAIEVESALVALDRWARLGVGRFPAAALLPRIWSLRDNLTAYDATYVALAEALETTLVTADRRLAAAAGPTCAITVVRS